MPPVGVGAAPLAALIVGAGPAGLASAACLKRRGVEALVLEAGPSLARERSRPMGCAVGATLRAP